MRRSLREQRRDSHQVVGEHSRSNPQLEAISSLGETALHAATSEQHRDASLDAGAKALALLEVRALSGERVCSVTDPEPDRLAPLPPPAPMGLRGVWVMTARCCAGTLPRIENSVAVGSAQTSPLRLSLVRLGRRFARALVISTLEGETVKQDAFRLLAFSKLTTLRQLGHRLGVS